MKVIIIGNGIAGSSAARHIRKWSDHEVFMISEETKFPFSRTALMYVYMGHLKLENTKLYEDDFWQNNGIQLIQDKVIAVMPDEKLIALSGGITMTYDVLIIASGSFSNKFGWPGQNLDGVQGLYHLQDLQSLEKITGNGISKAVIVGGGLIGVELAEMLHSRNIPVTMLVRETSFWDIVLPQEESAMINRHLIKYGIDLKLSTELKEIVGDPDGKVMGVVTKEGEAIKCEFVGLTVGVSPNIGFLNPSGLEFDKGILVNEFLQTSDSSIFAIGDCAQLRVPSPLRKPIEAVWYTGRMMGQVVAKSICEKMTPYDAGIWYNSAKFFDIEYQVYGHVTPVPEDGFDAIYWQHERKNISVRIVFNRSSGEVTGFNLMGIRFRHEVCEKWISQKTNIKTVLENLPLAYFDPEFFGDYTSKILRKASEKLGVKIKVPQQMGLNRVIPFLNK